MSKTKTLFFRYVFEKGDARRLKKLQQDVSDLNIRKDIPYIQDGDKGHLFDIYTLKNIRHDAPVMINLHGGGLFASYKEVNANFNYEWARLGYQTVSISYRRIPEVTLKQQISDVMCAIRYIDEHALELGLNMEKVYLSGDSAGALLAFYVLSIHGSHRLQEAFQEKDFAFQFAGAGLISIFLDTQRKDMMKCVSDMVLAQEEQAFPYAPYLLDPIQMLKETCYPPLYLVSGEQDLIQKDTLKFVDALQKNQYHYRFLNFPKGKERKLDHVFAVKYPKWPESKQVFEEMINYFKEVE